MKKMTYEILPIALIFGLAFLVTGCPEDEETPTGSGDPGGDGISSPAFPNNTANIDVADGPSSGTLEGGNPPYSITQPPDMAVATAALSGSNNEVLTITPIGEGNTSVTIGDTDPLMLDRLTHDSVTIAINVTYDTTGGGGGAPGFGGTGSASISTSEGTFSASGDYFENAVNGQGVGGARFTIDGGRSTVIIDGVAYDVCEMIGYNIRSVNDADLSFLSLWYMDGTLIPGEYSFVPFGSSWASMSIALGEDLQNPQNMYFKTEGSVNLASITATSASVDNINGSGIDFMNNPITVTGGTFAGSGFGSGPPAAPKTEIDRAILKIRDELRARTIEQIRSQRSQE